MGGIIEGLYCYFLRHENALPQEYQKIAAAEGVNRAVADYIAGMTDHYAIDVYSRLFIPKAWAGTL